MKACRQSTHNKTHIDETIAIPRKQDEKGSEGAQNLAELVVQRVRGLEQVVTAVRIREITPTG